MKTKVVEGSKPESVESALQAIQEGQAVAFPTDTVYGIGVSAYDPKAIKKLFAIKEREQSRSIAVLIASTTELEQVADHPSAQAQQLAQAFWPGPLTLVVPRNPRLPRDLSPKATIGVRIPDHPLALALLQAAGPLAVTSANLSGQPDCCTASEVVAQLDGRLSLVLDGGRTPGGVPSTVADTTGGNIRLLREGPLSMDDIRKVLE